MATYYKYAERSADSQINWAEIGKNMSDMLKEEARIREEKKAAIDAASSNYGKVLANAPQGEHEPARQAALKFADNASKYMLMQDKLLKSGQMSLRDYTISRQNLLDGTDSAFTALKDFQDVFAKKMERSRTGKSSLYELRKMEQAEGFGNFSQTEFYINPTNGSVNVAKKTKKIIDGKEVYAMDENPGEFASINYVKGLINGEWNKFDSNAVTDVFAKGLGEEMKSIQTQVASLSKTGLITSTSDITSRTDIDPDTKKIMFKFIDAENQMIDGALANPFNRASILTDNNVIAQNGKLYDITTDPAKAKSNPNLILEIIDPATGMGTLQFTPEQIKMSQDFMRNQVRAKYEYKQELKPTPQTQLQERRAPTGAEIEGEMTKKRDVGIATNIGALWGGTPAQIQSSLSAFRDMNPNIRSINRNSSGVTVEIIDPNTRKTQVRTLPFGNMNQEQFIMSAAPLLAGNVDVKTAIKQGGFIKGAKFNPSTNLSATVEAQQIGQQQQQNPFQIQGYTPPAINASGVGSKY